MSEVSDAATVRILLAEYAATDPAGKINIIGGGLTGLGHNPNTGMTTAFALFASVGVPHRLYNSECSVEILLENPGGGLVSVPGPAPGMPAQPVRVGQAVRFERPSLPQQFNAPQNHLDARTQWVLGFTTGLPLVPGQGYIWRVKIDDETRDEWTEKFVVLGPAAGPVLG